MNRRLPWVIDLVFCVLLLPALILLLPIERWQQHDATFVALLIVWLYGVYFLMRHAVVPMLFSGSRPRQVAALAMVVLTVAVTWWLTQYDLTPPPRVHHRPMRPHAMQHGGDARRAAGFYGRVRQAVWFLYVTVVALSTAVGLLTQIFQLMLKRQSLEYEKNRAELALYKAQINPHFLFNTLNTLYGLLITDQEKAEQAFMQFTQLMKYQYENAQSDHIPISTEVEYITQYIELERTRMNEKTTVAFTHSDDGSRPGATIAPMLLISFVENAFKFGASSHEVSTIAFTLHVKDGTLVFTAANRIINPAKKGKGIGLDNSRRRLELLYPGRYELSCGPDAQNENYHVNLTITL